MSNSNRLAWHQRTDRDAAAAVCGGAMSLDDLYLIVFVAVVGFVIAAYWPRRR